MATQINLPFSWDEIDKLSDLHRLQPDTLAVRECLFLLSFGKELLGGRLIREVLKQPIKADFLFVFYGKLPSNNRLPANKKKQGISEG